MGIEEVARAHSPGPEGCRKTGEARPKESSHRPTVVTTQTVGKHVKEGLAKS